MYVITEEAPVKYFSMIPHIIYELGLDAYEIAVYCLLKRISCENSSCTYSNEALAKLVNISVSKLKQIKKKLSETFSLIKLPLILCKERKSESGGSQTTEIKIVNIWPHNSFCFEQKKAEKKEAKSEEKCEIQNNFTGHEKTPPPGHQKTTKKNKEFKNKKEINKEKDSSSNAEPSSVDLQLHDSSELKPTISFPFSFSKEDMSVIHSSVSQTCPDKKTLVQVLRHAEKSDFWKKIITRPSKAIKNFKTMYDQALEAFAKEDLIAKRRQFAKHKEFQDCNSYALCDHEKLTIVSGGYSESFYFAKECEYWTSHGLGADHVR